MQIKASIAAVALALLAGNGTWALNAQPSVPGVRDAGRVSAGLYTADAAHSQVGWSLSHFGFNDYFGIFGDVAGELSLDPANPAAARVDVTIPVASVTVPSAGQREHLLRPGADGAAPDFFGPEPQPARFVSTSVVPGPDHTALIHGHLTLNGRTKPVAIAASFAGAGTNPMTRKDTVGFHGRAAIDRSDFGITTALPLVSDRVLLDISVAFEKGSGAVPPPAARLDTDDPCRAAELRPAIGRPATPAYRAEIAAARPGQAIRWLHPTSMVTTDYRPDRLNIVTEPRTDRILALRCG